MRISEFVKTLTIMSTQCYHLLWMASSNAIKCDSEQVQCLSIAQLNICFILLVLGGWGSDNAIHWINLYPVDNTVCFVIIYPLDSDLSVE